MGNKTAIQWCDATFNPWWGCTRISPACDFCYADAWARRTGRDLWDNGERRPFGDKHWAEPLKWARTLPAKLGRRPRVFCASMADVFDKDAPSGARERLWCLIAATPELDWLLLTKRIGNVPRMVPPWITWPSNIWLGITVANQEEVDRDVPKLLDVPAQMRFLSCEPLLGPVDLTAYRLTDRRTRKYPFPMLAPENRTTNLELLDWVIVGGESGSKQARPFDPAWARSIIEQCRVARVAVFVKQLGKRPQEIAYPTAVTDNERKRWHADGWTSIVADHGEHWRRYWRLKDAAGGAPAEWPEDLRVREFPNG